MEQQQQWKYNKYLGDISALCFLHLPSPFPLLLLAGTGSEILVYDLETKAAGQRRNMNIINSFNVFHAIRVHGISSSSSSSLQQQDNNDSNNNNNTSCCLRRTIAVFGERRLKLFTLHITTTSTTTSTITHIQLTLLHSLPKFPHWVLDAHFFLSSTNDPCLAVGCSDNSLYFFPHLTTTTPTPNTNYIFSHLHCSERCLLYSMTIFGNDFHSLRIASGTIFNHILVWKLLITNDDILINNNGQQPIHPYLPSNNYTHTLIISRLLGHEGSIFNIAWFPNGLKLVSVSDDRSARIWDVPNNNNNNGFSSNDNNTIDHLPGPVLFGHNARIWDCCISDSLIITAGEDCTCRVWDHDGRQLNEIKEHIGRGVWRCLYDPGSSLLVTAGFDSAIKVHQLCISSKGLEGTVSVEDSGDRKEVFALPIPNPSGHGGFMDSKSEYVRCLHFSSEDSLYVATNNGYLYHVSLFNNEAVKWTELARISKEAPIICMDLLSKCSKPSDGLDDWIAVGDGKGSMAVVQVIRSGQNPKVEVTFTWLAEKERHLLGTYWSKSLENRFVFTADPGGRLKLWKLNQNFPSSSIGREGYDGLLVAEFASCFGMRIMCVDASFDEELLVCGDIRGNLILFSLPTGLLCCCAPPIAAEVVKASSPVNYFKGAHGVSSVSSVSVGGGGVCSDQVEICSTGADGCICHLQYDRDLLNLEFKGMKQVKELSTIRSVFHTTDHSDDSSVGNYAVGFASENFIIWNLTSGTKVIQITCGGWRRPHSYYLGDFPEIMNCFSFVKDDIIYIHRHWVPENDSQIYPRTLHLQFHGREIHSLCFISGHSSDENQGLVSESSWIATGSEDGSVRLTRYEHGMENWSSSQHLGEHVGGSAVRSVCFVSKMHIFMPDSIINGQMGTLLEDRDNPCILISVGAKRVVTAWKQMTMMRNKRLGTLYSEVDNNNPTGPAQESAASLSFQWLSTDMPFKQNSNAKRKNTKEVLETAENLGSTLLDSISVESLSSEFRKIESNLCFEDDHENDWRYLDVTAFLVKEAAGSRISICFVIVACSDATVTVRALVLPSRLWFDVATLAPLASPVLSLQHVIIPKLLPSKGKHGSFYWAITGSTDGSLAIWDLTECVENFMKRISSVEMENMEFQIRPRTGRGSQGGRRRRLIDINNGKKKPKDGRVSIDHGVLMSEERIDVSVGRTETGNEVGNHPKESSRKLETPPLSEKSNDHDALQRKRDDDDLLPEETSHVLLASMHVLKNVHQSGVNCLYVSEIEQLTVSDSRLLSFYIVSGGDDQSINCFQCNLEINPMMRDNIHCSNNSSTQSVVTFMNNNNNNDDHHRLMIQNHQIQFLYLDKIASAHSSAVKGVWTDGMWVISVGLDQRIRCWRVNGDGLVECAHIIISVPEPEALDVKTCGRNHYEIAVGGRGMQMVQFRPSTVET